MRRVRRETADARGDAMRRARRTAANPVDLLVFQCKAAKLPEPKREYRFHATRRWRFDVAFFSRCEWEDHPMLAVEVDGGVYVQGRHSRGAGIEADMEKYAEAMMLGWRILRVTPQQLKNGEAYFLIDRALGITK